MILVYNCWHTATYYYLMWVCANVWFCLSVCLSVYMEFVLPQGEITVKTISKHTMDRYSSYISASVAASSQQWLVTCVFMAFSYSTDIW